MDELLDQEKPSGKIFSEKNFGLAIILGGPLAGAFVFSHNFKVLGDINKSKSSWLIGVIIFFFLIFIPYLLPETINIPNFVYVIATIIVYQQLFKKYLKEKVDLHQTSGGDKFHWIVSLLVGLIGMILTFVVIYAFYYYWYGVRLF
jgi:hypothetical protein